MMLFIVALVIILFFVLIFKSESRMCAYDDEEVITTTTTTTEPEFNIVGHLRREIEGSQSFVIDPVDKEKIWLNSNDDMYEDADGKVWRVV